jgi:chromosome partitioning protein
MKVIGVCGRKGGSGKTTIAIHLAADFAARGIAAGLVDADPQCSALHWDY